MKQGLSPQLLDAIGQRLERKEQSLIFLNRRGYAPVLHCQSCAWVSNCPRCTAFTVLHRSGNGGNRLHCHHCGYQATVPRACPECGDQDLAPMGRGTQRIEEHLAELFPEARILRIDADSTRRKAAPKRCSRRCTRARSTSWWARRWWPRATTSRAWGWWVCSTPIPCCSRMISARPNACSRSSCRWLAAPAAIRTMARC